MSDRTLSLFTAAPLGRVGSQATGWTAVLRRALRAMRTRHDLAALEPRLLADIGVSRAEALREAERAPWDLEPPSRGPQHPRRRPRLSQRLGRTFRLVWSRRRIATLDERLLKDIGVSVAEAEWEANKPFWRW